MKKLPSCFIDEMKNLLSDEDFDKYIESFNENYYRSIRINTLKCTVEKACSLLPFEVTETPFCDTGFYIPYDVNIGSMVLHHAGAFYSQEPSAMSAVTVLDVKKGDRVLDLCAAPGGKSTQIAAELDGTGLLWSNEIVKNRANILLSNIERMGIRNAVVSSCYPEVLCRNLPEFFDKILVDAPCSGEGMFRKDENAISEWSSEHSKACAERQLAILESASQALKEGGEMVYSTCTFSYIENENVIEQFLARHSDFELVDSGVSFGRPSMQKAVRIFPMDGGEGHFAAKLRKKGDLIENIVNINTPHNIKNPDLQNICRMYDEIFKNRLFGENFEIVGDKVIAMPEGFSAYKGLGILRAGVLLGEIKKNRIEPCHGAFMATGKSDVNNCVDISVEDDRLNKFLRGEEISVDENLKGFVGVFADGISVGFGKAVNGILKNRYPKGLRIFK